MVRYDSGGSGCCVTLLWAHSGQVLVKNGESVCVRACIPVFVHCAQMCDYVLRGRISPPKHALTRPSGHSLTCPSWARSHLSLWALSHPSLWDALPCPSWALSHPSLLGNLSPAPPGHSLTCLSWAFSHPSLWALSHPSLWALSHLPLLGTSYLLW